MATVNTGKRQPTLEKLLTGVFLKKRLVDHRPSQVVHHQEEDRLNLLLSIAGVVSKNIVLASC